MKTHWFAPDPDHHKFRREAYESKDYERELLVISIALFIVDAILWVGILAIDFGWIWKGWVMP